MIAANIARFAIRIAMGCPIAGIATAMAMVFATARTTARTTHAATEPGPGSVELPAGVSPAGYHVAPTIFGQVKVDATIAREEIFGPVLSIISYTDEDDAVRIANGSVYNLAGGVWSDSDEHVETVARRLRTGRAEASAVLARTVPLWGGP